MRYITYQQDNLLNWAVKPIELAPLNQIPLSTQLRRITGDSYNTIDFVNLKNDELTSEAGNTIIHRATGLQFLIP